MRLFSPAAHRISHIDDGPVLTNTSFRSKLRQVPDNQEVWIDKDGFTSIIFDISERVGGPGSSPEIDGRAMTTHLEDMVGADIDTVKIWNTAETEFTKMSEYVRFFWGALHFSPSAAKQYPANRIPDDAA